MTTPIDVLGLGCVAVDELLFVDAYPSEDTKAPIQQRERQCGGLTATALVAAARMGARCAYAGTLGEDPASHFVAGRLSQENIDLRYLRLKRNVRPIQSTIIVGTASGTRTILYDLSVTQGAGIDWPPAEAIHNTRVLFVDHFGVEGMTRAARLARKAGVSVVADFECDPGGCFAELMDLVDHLVISERFACQLSGRADPAEAACSLWHHSVKPWWSRRASAVVGTSVTNPLRCHSITRRLLSTPWIPRDAATFFTGPMPPLWPKGLACPREFAWPRRRRP